MNLEYLKRVRVGVSLLFFVLTAVVFLDFANLVPPAYVGGLLYPQFVPSLLKFANLAGVATAGFLIALVLAMLLGRLYCSSICPLGTFQDIIAFLARKFRRKRVYRVTPPLNILRYSILGVTVVVLLLGSVVLVDLLDPFSNFGRMFANIFRPALIGLNNGAAFALEKLQVYWLYRTEIRNLGLVSLAFPVVMLGLIGWMSFTRGRLYCNTVCPVGALLSIVSRASLYRISIDKGDCKGCGLCEKACKAECIDRKKKTVDFSRCVGCFNCFSVCPRDGMLIERSFGGKKDVPAARATDERRRQVVMGMLPAFLAFQLSPVSSGEKKTIVATKPSTVPNQKNAPVCPPGSRSLEHFNSTCTACHLCVSACPTHVLAPSFLQYGIAGIFQPTMEYTSGYCNYDCVLCSQVCPSGAILPIALEQKKLAQLGTAKFIKDNCIVNTENTDCGACSEHCPTKAVNMVPYKGKLVIPEVKSDYCIGCGACEHACPTKPYKAIFVDGSRVHGIAKKAEEKKIEQKIDYKEDFPF